MADSPAAVSRASLLPAQVSCEICVSLVTARSGLRSPHPRLSRERTGSAFTSGVRLKPDLIPLQVLTIGRQSRESRAGALARTLGPSAYVSLMFALSGKC